MWIAFQQEFNYDAKLYFQFSAFLLDRDDPISPRSRLGYCCLLYILLSPNLKHTLCRQSTHLSRCWETIFVVFPLTRNQVSKTFTFYNQKFPANV